MSEQDEQQLTPEEQVQVLTGEYMVLQNKYETLLRRFVAIEDQKLDQEVRVAMQKQASESAAAEVATGESADESIEGSVPA